jgi:hypothetical protein
VSRADSSSDGKAAAVCDRFEREGLLRLEQGLPLAAHFDDCPECRAARQQHERLRAGIAGMESTHTGRADWQARVWAGLERRRARRGRRWLWLMAPAVVAAAAVLLVIGRSGPDGPILSYTIQRPAQDAQGAGPLRSDHVQPGDTLVVRAVAGGARAELRLYRGDRELVLRCSEEPPCTRHGDMLLARVPMDERGRYQLVFLRAERSPPEPTGELDRDIAAARSAGVTVELRELDVL